MAWYNAVLDNYFIFFSFVSLENWYLPVINKENNSQKESAWRHNKGLLLKANIFSIVELVLEKHIYLFAYKEVIMYMLHKYICMITLYAFYTRFIQMQTCLSNNSKTVFWHICICSYAAGD